MKQLTNVLRPSHIALLLTLLIVSFSGCGSEGNSVVVPEEGPMTEQELQDYEQGIQEGEQNYEDRYK